MATFQSTIILSFGYGATSCEASIKMTPNKSRLAWEETSLITSSNEAAGSVLYKLELSTDLYLN